MTPSLPARSEVVVIGGGAVGLQAALLLRESGRDVTVLERRAFAGEASGVNAGTLAVQNKLTALVPYTLAALRDWQGFAARFGTDVGFRQPGGYNVATNDAERIQLQRNAEVQESLGVRVRWLERSEIRAEAPWLGEAVIAASHSPDDAFASPLSVATALKRKLRSVGVRLIDSVEVLRLEESAGVSVGTTRGTVNADQVLIACGAWSGALTALLGVVLPIKLDVNMLSVTEPCGPVLPAVVTHARGILTVKQSTNGTCLIGGGWQGRGTLEDDSKDVEYESIVHNVRLAARIIPALERVHLVRQWTGYEGVTADSLPYLGRLPGSSRVHVAACARGGFTLSPILARLIHAEMVGERPTLPTNLFRPERHAHA